MAMHDIRRAALALFARHGYEGTSLSDIAKAVGIKTPSIYAHFVSKDDLYLAVLDWVLEEQDRLLEEALGESGGKTAEEKLRRLYGNIAAGYKLQLESAFYKRAVFFSPASLQSIVRERVLRLEQKLAQALRAVLEEGRRRGELGDVDTDTVVAAFLCQLDGMFLEFDLYEPELFARRLEQVWSLFWRGVSGSKE
jgi:AcrR family transcriptional regulator